MRQIKKITLATDKIFLSGDRRVYKTEGFIRLTRRISGADDFVSLVSDGVFAASFSPCNPENAVLAETEDKLFTLFFRQGLPCDERIGSGDLIFYKFISRGESETGAERNLADYLLSHPSLDIVLREISDACDEDEFRKLYIVSGKEGVNFPLLSKAQRAIVETENSNILVQGVAGSGKTNVCVEKIVYCACRRYRGKILYTTFSRGLLSSTKYRVEQFMRSVESFVSSYEKGNVVFLDKNHKQAVENKLGIVFDVDDDGRIIESLRQVAAFLREKVDYKLIEDLYADRFGQTKVTGERDFIEEYIGDVRNYRLSGALEKIKNLSAEIIYKEIYGMIFGKYDIESPKKMMSREEYAEARKDSFSRAECDVIYTIALDYASYAEKNSLSDNNSMSRELLSSISDPVYSVGIIDETQDFTQVNLCLIKKMCLKLFCVGDALQMINPAYFSFGYLKKLMYGEVTGVSELRHNYRSSEKIEKIAEKLGELNVRRFGTHSFVLKGESVRSSEPAAAVFVKEKDFALSLADKRFGNVTVIVASRQKKERLRKKLDKIEILTVAEAKGLERDAVILADVLSDNADKWRYLRNMTLNRKTADENSVFRYYFNLFYVGISRAKRYLFVTESEYPDVFEELFHDCFERCDKKTALGILSEVAEKTELTDDELVDRIEKFCELEQYENAFFAAEKISDDALRAAEKSRISVHERFLRYGRERDAGIEYWKLGLEKDAREIFIRSGNEELLPLMDACSGKNNALNVDIVKFYPLVSDNDTAKRLIIETVKNDYNEIMGSQKAINESLKSKRRKQ